MPEDRKLTVAEIALMRQIIAWRKQHGVDFVRRITPYGAPYWKDYPTKRQVWFQLKEENPMTIVAAQEAWSTAVPAESFSQAVDLLVAYGHLPPRFSSAYRYGWDAAEGWYRKTETGAGDPPVQQRMVSA